MRPTMRPDTILERLALWLNLGPVPVAEAMFGMGTTRVVMAGVRLGIYAELARADSTAADVARGRGLNPDGALLLLDCLTALGHVKRKRDRYRLTSRARRWLDPQSPTYVGAFLEFNYDQWEWWSHLEEVVQTGRPYQIHDFGEEDPRWRRYIEAMFQLARLSAPEVAARLHLPPEPKRILDLAGGHGWFAAELCKRYPGMRATVVDLPGSARIGREIIARERMPDRVRFLEGDILSDPLPDPEQGEPYSGALAFQIIHHLTPEQNVELFRRVREVLQPDGTLAVLDYFASPSGRAPDAAAFLGLHFFLTSGAATYTPGQLTEWLLAAGFSAPRRLPLRRIPIQTLYEARRK